ITNPSAIYERATENPGFVAVEDDDLRHVLIANGKMNDLLVLVGVLGEDLAGKRNLGVADVKETFILQGIMFEFGELGLAALGPQSPVDQRPRILFRRKPSRSVK